MRVSQVATKPSLKLSEFVPLMASMTSLVALTIDAMLPALSAIGDDLQVADPNQTALVISMIFLGMSLGQPLYGTLSDSWGRKPTVYMGFAIYVLGSVVSWFAPTLLILLVGRVLQGFGVSGPRVVVMALVRDQYAGDQMARVMSVVMMVFILIPTVAPALGQGILHIAGWRAIFASFVVIGTLIVAWFAWRQPETLTKAERKPLKWSVIGTALREIFRNPIAWGYTFAAGLISGAFLGFLSSIEPILNRQFGLEEEFAGYFAMLALFIGSASFVNSRLVMRVGSRRMSQTFLIILILLAVGFLTYLIGVNQHPGLWTVMPYLFGTLFCVGILFGNLNSMAMEPLGHIAGIGSSVVSATGTLLALPVSIVISQLYNGTVIPMVSGFAVLGICTLVLILYIEKKRPSASNNGVG